MLVRLFGDVLPSMEWQVNERCVDYDECELFTPFVETGNRSFILSIRVMRRM